MQPLKATLPAVPCSTPPCPPPQFECYEYLFEAAVRMRQMGLDAGRAPAPPLVAAANGQSIGALAAEGFRGKSQGKPLHPRPLLCLALL